MALKPIPPEELTFAEAITPQIRIESWSNSARTLQVRGFCKDSLISFDHTTNSDRSVASDDFDIPDIPLMLNVSPSTGPVRRGECYVRLTLLMAGFPVGRLISAYLTDGKTLTWPPGVQEGFTEGPGLLRIIVGTDPAAGAEHTETVPTNARWKLRSILFRLVTDGTAATRTVVLLIDDGTNTVFFSDIWGDQTASLTIYYCAGPGLEADSSGSIRQMGLPVECDLFQAWRILTSTTNLQAGDNFGPIYLLVEEWIEE